MQNLNSAPKVSIVLPVFNAEAYIGESIVSLINQTFKNFELIIIDDASTDGSLAAIYKFSDPRIKIIENEKNLGIVGALNRGIEAATGKYIARMDADDICYPDRLKIQIEYLEENHDIGLVGSWINGFGVSIRSYIHKYPISHEDIEACMLFQNPIAHPTVVIRREILVSNQLRYSNEFPYVEDWELFSRVIQLTKFHNIPRPLLKYRIHPSSSSQHHTISQNKSRLNLVRKLFAMRGLPLDENFFLANPIGNSVACKAFGEYLKTLQAVNAVTESLNQDSFNKAISMSLYDFSASARNSALSIAYYFYNNCFLEDKKLYLSIILFIKIFRRFLLSMLKK